MLGYNIIIQSERKIKLYYFGLRHGDILFHLTEFCFLINIYLKIISEKTYYQPKCLAVCRTLVIVIVLVVWTLFSL